LTQDVVVTFLVANLRYIENISENSGLPKPVIAAFNGNHPVLISITILENRLVMTKPNNLLSQEGERWL
jgi:hypothetical protein